MTAELLNCGGEQLLGARNNVKELEQSKNNTHIQNYERRKTDCINYSGIALLNMDYKVLATAIKNKIILKMKKVLGE